MYTGKIDLLVSYHFNDDAGCATICQETIEVDDLGKRLQEIYYRGWEGDDGTRISEWPDTPELPTDGYIYGGDFYQLCSYIGPREYFLAVATPTIAK